MRAGNWIFLFSSRPQHKEKWAGRRGYDFGKALERHFRGIEYSAPSVRRSFTSDAAFPFTEAKCLGDRAQVVEPSYRHLAPNTGEINKVA